MHTKHLQAVLSFWFTFIFWWRCGPTRAMAPLFFRFLDHTQRRITVGRTPLDEWSARRIDLYLTTHNTHNRQTSMPPVGFEPTISAVERPQTYALDRAATVTGSFYFTNVTKFIKSTNSIKSVDENVWPRRRWVDNIRMDLQEVGYGYTDWIGLPQDRDRWRTLWVR